MSLCQVHLRVATTNESSGSSLQSICDCFFADILQFKFSCTADMYQSCRNSGYVRSGTQYHAAAMSFARISQLPLLLPGSTYHPDSGWLELGCRAVPLLDVTKAVCLGLLARPAIQKGADALNEVSDPATFRPALKPTVKQSCSLEGSLTSSFER